MPPEQPTRPPTEHTTGVGWCLTVLLRAYHTSVNSVVGDLPHGPRGYHVLATVVHDQPPSQLALADHLGVDRTVMTYVIDDLVAAGLVERQANPADRRQRMVVATERGKRVLADHQERVRQAEDDLLDALEPGERDALRRLLRRVACDVRDIDVATDPCDVVDAVLSQDTASHGRR